MDLTEFKKSPYKREMRLLGQHLLDKDTNLRDILMSEAIHYKVLKNYLYYSQPEYEGEFFKI